MKINYLRLKAALAEKFGKLSAFLVTECGFVIVDGRNPSRVLMKCPRHSSKSNERGGNCNANDSKGVWQCFSCSEGGGWIEGLMFGRNMSKDEAVEYLANLVGMNSGEERPANDMEILHLYCIIAASLLRKVLEEGTGHPLVMEAISFLTKTRAIAEPVVKKLGFGVADVSPRGPIFCIMRKKYGLTDEDFVRVGLLRRDEKGRLHARFAYRVICWTGSNIYGRHFRESDLPHLYSSNGNVLYNTRTIREKMDVVFVVESILDAATIQGYIDDLHYPWGVIASLGTSFSEDGLAKYLLSKKPAEVILVPDCDDWRKKGMIHARGQKSAIKRANAFQKGGLATRVVTLPDGTDPNDMGKNGWDAQKFEKAVNDALPPILYRLFCTAHVFDLKTEGGRQRYLNAARKELATDPGAAPSEVVRFVAEQARLPMEDVSEALSGSMRKALARKALQKLIENGALTSKQAEAAVAQL